MTESSQFIRKRLVYLLQFLAVALLLPLTGCVTMTPASKEKPAINEAPPESSFTKLEITVPGSDRTYPTWRTKSYGKPILLLHPINGLNPDLLHFALELEDWGYRVYMPSLYGDPILGKPAYGYDKGMATIKVIRKDGNWNPIATDTLGPVTDDVAYLARWVSRKEGRNIAVMGNSLTGSFPLAILDEPSVKVAVLAQPATPVMKVPQIMMRIPQSEEMQRSLSMSESDWGKTVSALRRYPSKRIIGFHYSNDPIAPIAKFDELHDRLADAGLSSRFKAYVKSPADSDYAKERSGWVVGSETAEKRKMLTPHSTYIVPENFEDQEWFRRKLKSSLGQLWW
ncbi:MAG: hypothetical protein CMO55_03815 [Verrucomicrobiales bacterium]|nr:hypothetical protein [Verrucomicrobiales bacterium]